MSEIPRALCRKWIHSNEEDTEEESVYRPENFNFPPSRYRNQFEICDNGEIIQYVVAQGAMTTKTSSKFKIVEDGIIKIIAEDLKLPQITITTYDDNILKVKKKKR
jgi:hypothetical protein